MKNVGLITFHRPVNFGAALQAVALFKTIRAMGAQCHLIDYRNPFFEKRYRAFHLPHRCSVKTIAWSLAMVPYNLKQISGFRRFVRENTELTKPIKTKAELAEMGSQYDLYITGSDQVWNLDCSGGETAYFLDFVSDKSKNAYAASFGDWKVTEGNADLYQSLLSDFDNISVRERSGVAMVKELTGKDCVQTLDPTLLLDQKQWDSIAGQTKRLLDKEYVLLYFMAASKEARAHMRKVAKQIAKSRGCEILLIGGSMHKVKDGIHYANPTSPYEFVSLFRDAAFVVTNSFHGTAFSVNYQKPFYSYVKPELTVEGRVESLLKLLGLETRIFSYSEEIPDVDQAINYSAAGDALIQARNSSLQYLQGVLYGRQ